MSLMAVVLKQLVPGNQANIATIFNSLSILTSPGKLSAKLSFWKLYSLDQDEKCYTHSNCTVTMVSNQQPYTHMICGNFGLVKCYKSAHHLESLRRLSNVPFYVFLVICQQVGRLVVLLSYTARLGCWILLLLTPPWLMQFYNFLTYFLRSASNLHGDFDLSKPEYFLWSLTEPY